MAVISSKTSIQIPDDIRSFPRLMLRQFEEYGDKPAIVSTGIIVSLSRYDSR